MKDGNIFVLVDQQNWYMKNRYDHQHIQWNLHQNSNDFFHKTGKIKPKIHAETQKTQDSQIKLFYPIWKVLRDVLNLFIFISKQF